jgi:hypothetical protein
MAKAKDIVAENKARMQANKDAYAASINSQITGLNATLASVKAELAEQDSPQALYSSRLRSAQMYGYSPAKFEENIVKEIQRLKTAEKDVLKF